MKRLLVTICVIVPLVLVVFALSPRAQNAKRFTFEIAFIQKAAPIQMPSVTHGVNFLYQSAEVKNTSDRTIRSITFGVLAHEIGPNWNKPTLVASREIATNISPGQTISVDVADAPVGDIQQKVSELKSNPVGLEFGILGVQFADDTTWQYDWQSAGSFDPRNMFGSLRNSAAIRRGCGASAVHSALTALAGSAVVPGIAAVFAQGYTCGTTSDREYCENHLTSCTDHICNMKQPPCPYQVCTYVP